LETPIHSMDRKPEVRLLQQHEAGNDSAVNRNTPTTPYAIAREIAAP